MTDKKPKKSLYFNYLLIVALLVSLATIGYLLYRIDYLNKTLEWKTSLSVVSAVELSYCQYKNNTGQTDEEIENNLKALPQISNAVIENYEGEKTLYVSYFSYDGGTWADQRRVLDNCN